MGVNGVGSLLPSPKRRVDRGEEDEIQCLFQGVLMESNTLTFPSHVFSSAFLSQGKTVG